MITLITGVPGSGKTAHVVQLILEELKKERTIYCVGIPDLVAHHKYPDASCPDGFRYFAVEKCGNPLTWQRGSWLRIQSYRKQEMAETEFGDDESDCASSSWSDNEHKDYTRTIENVNVLTGEITDKVVPEPYPDQGALVIIDECQSYFRPRSSATAVPDYIAAFEVHRHQGLDFWLLTQRPSLIDGNLRGLVSKHIHIKLSTMGRKKLEWAECQNPDSSSSRALASSTSYKPNPKVFDLYQSAQVHTKLKIKLPNAVYMLGVLFVVLCLSVGFVYTSFSSRFSTPARSAVLQTNHSSSLDANKASLQHEQSYSPTSLKSPSKTVPSPVVVSPVVAHRPFYVFGFAKLPTHNVAFVRDSLTNLVYEIRPTFSHGRIVYQDKVLSVGSYASLHADDILVFVAENNASNSVSSLPR